MTKKIDYWQVVAMFVLFLAITGYVIYLFIQLTHPPTQEFQSNATSETITCTMYQKNHQVCCEPEMFRYYNHGDTKEISYHKCDLRIFLPKNESYWHPLGTN